ncbi:MAG: M20 family metallopeptidase [Eubacteriales bacterium]|nr:M20 family metallopeptidase [Eubacteriales bacterium]
MSYSYYEEAKELQEQLTSWRRELHQIPELGLHLPKTMDYLCKELDQMNVSYDRMDDISCIFVTIGSGSPCILLRGDMDALPIKEESGEGFSSTNGCMHACGHDLHAATMLGLTNMMKKHEKELKGTVKILFQSAEETFEGAYAAIKKGVLENPKVDAAFAMHVFAEPDEGILLFGPKPMASVFGFKIIITGHGGHGSQPEKCIDPINAGVQVYMALQALISRECPPTKEAALTIGHFEAGSVPNAIPSEAILEGTLRTFEPEVRELLMRRIKEIVPAVASAYRCKCEVITLSDVPCLNCDETFLNDALESAKKSGAIEDMENGLHLIGSEDFAFYSEQVPSCYFVMGAGVKNKEERVGQHNPKIRFEETSMVRNLAVYMQVAMDYLEK